MLATRLWNKGFFFISKVPLNILAVKHARNVHRLWAALMCVFKFYFCCYATALTCSTHLFRWVFRRWVHLTWRKLPTGWRWVAHWVTLSCPLGDAELILSFRIIITNTFCTVFLIMRDCFSSFVKGSTLQRPTVFHRLLGIIPLWKVIYIQIWLISCTLYCITSLKLFLCLLLGLYII